MSWAMLPAWYRDIATDVLTPRELEVVKLDAANYSHRRIADALRIAPTTVRDTRDRAIRKIEAHPDFRKDAA